MITAKDVTIESGIQSQGYEWICVSVTIDDKEDSCTYMGFNEKEAVEDFLNYHNK